MVAAHSGTLAGSGAGWEALTRGYGLHRVSDLAEMADALELFSLLTRRHPRAGLGIATVHDSGLERAHAADVADELSVPFAPLAQATRARLTELLDAGLVATNPLDVWGTGASTRKLFSNCLTILADDESVQAVALAVDLVTELDGDDSYQLAVLDAAARTDKPIVVIANLPSAIDPRTAALLRGDDIHVLEGMRTGLAAMRHLLDRLDRRPPPWPPKAPVDRARLARAHELLARCGETGAAALALLADYGIARRVA
jgi:acetate---CoA ligase (ADP-forming)